jgi:hypothetical protein
MIKLVSRKAELGYRFSPAPNDLRRQLRTQLDSTRYVAIVPRMLLADRDAIYLGLAAE